MTGSLEPSHTDLEATRVESTEGSEPSVGEVGVRSGASLPRGSMVSRYMIVDELGAGGMGEVFSAWDPELDRRIALKLVKLSQREKAQHARSRLLREAQALAKLSHPNVVAVYDVGTHGDRVFIAMEHVEGRTMADWIEDASAGPPGARWREGLSLMLQAGRGLAAAHAEGLVHRDFKPANIMVSVDGRVRVLDFGLARRFGDDSEDSGPTPRELAPDSLDSLDGSGPISHGSLVSGSHGSLVSGSHGSRSSLHMQLTQAGMVMGTPAYMAPEQFFGGSIDARTDQFSFCIVLWRVLHGARPFEGETFHELGRAVAHADLREPPKVPGLPRAIRAALRRGLAVSRDERWPTMDALLDALERAVGQGRRRLAWAAGGALVIAGGLAGAVTLAAAEAPCRGAPERLAGVWDEPRRTAVAEAFERTALPYAEDVHAAAEASLDAWTERWIELHGETCEATRVRGDQSEALMDLRIGCLDGKLRDVAALTAVLAKADADVVKNAAQAAQALPSPEDCATLERGASDLLQPADPALATAVEEVRTQVAQARALAISGKYEDGAAVAAPALAAARQTGYEPAIAEAAMIVGDLAEKRMAAAAAREAYDEAVFAAAASGHARIEAQALIGLLSLWGMHLSDTDRALGYGRHAEAVLRRMGGAPELEAALSLYRGNTLMSASRYEAATTELELAVARSEGVAAAERIHLAALNNLAAVQGQQGRYREAIASFERSLALSEARLGPWHPTIATHFLNLGVTQARLEDHEPAMRNTRRALEIYVKSLGPAHGEVGRAHHNLGVIESATGNVQAAYESYREALAIKKRALGPDHTSVAFSANNVADALIKLGRAREAIPYCEDALRIWTAAQGTENPANIYPLISLGEAHLALGEPARAVTYIRRALALAEVGEIDPIEIAKGRFVAARALWASGGDRQEAIALAEHAQRGYAASERPSLEELAAIEEWLAERR